MMMKQRRRSQWQRQESLSKGRGREGQGLLSERREIERAPLRKTTHLGASPLKIIREWDFFNLCCCVFFIFSNWFFVHIIGATFNTQIYHIFHTFDLKKFQTYLALFFIT
jgi:hypothetical protein